MHTNKLLSNNQAFNGIYRGRLLKKSENDIRVFIPGIYNSQIKESNLEDMIDCFPKIQWCAYNLESIDINNQDNNGKGPAMIMFENGDLQRPVVLSYVVIGSDSNSVGSSGYYDANGNWISSNDSYISSIAGDWITGYLCTVYGNTSADDNGIMGWLNKSYRTILGCHVAIPEYCIKESKKYNEEWMKNDYPEFSEGYGTVLEVKNPKNKKTVVAVVADCGNFGKHSTYNHNAALDLPPNTQNALDIHDTQEIEYRVIGHISSWNGEQLKLEDFQVSSSGNTIGEKAISWAKNHTSAQGYSYVYGADGPKSYDCSHYVWRAYKDGAGLINLPYATTTGLYNGSWETEKYGFKVVTGTVQVGDILIRETNNNHHVDMYLGNGYVIGAHSASTGIHGNSKYNISSYNKIIRYSK